MSDIISFFGATDGAGNASFTASLKDKSGYVYLFSSADSGTTWSRLLLQKTDQFTDTVTGGNWDISFSVGGLSDGNKIFALGLDGEQNTAVNSPFYSKDGKTYFFNLASNNETYATVAGLTGPFKMGTGVDVAPTQPLDPIANSGGSGGGGSGGGGSGGGGYVPPPAPSPAPSPTPNPTPIWGLDPQFGTPLTGQTSQNDFYKGGTGGGGLIDGLSGIDTAVYNFDASNYDITRIDGKVVITGPNGIDTLANFERAQFADYTVVFNYNSPKTDFLYQLYQAAFDRVPDLGGYEWWAAKVQNEGITEINLSKGFLAAPENVVLYGTNVSNADFITNLYGNVLDRAPEQQGYDYWLGLVNAGVDRAQILIGFTVSLENQVKTAPHMDGGLWMV